MTQLSECDETNVARVSLRPIRSQIAVEVAWFRTQIAVEVAWFRTQIAVEIAWFRSQRNSLFAYQGWSSFSRSGDFRGIDTTSSGYTLLYLVEE